MFVKAFECHIPVSINLQTAIECLSSAIETQGLSKQQLKTVMQKGAVWLSTSKEDIKPKRIRRAKRLLQVGNILHLYYNSEVLNITITAPKIIADCGEYSVWHKPKGMLSQGSKWGDHTTINRWIELNYRPHGETKTAIIVHRLDKATDGLMLIAHSKSMAKQLTVLFEERKIIKIYQAWVLGKFPEQKQKYTNLIADKKALSHAKKIKFDAKNNRSLVEINIETGRKHQIRIHLSQAGYPIIGDRLYHQNTIHEEDLQLTATQIELEGHIPILQRIFTLTPISKSK